jgi:hypothetical protein
MVIAVALQLSQRRITQRSNEVAGPPASPHIPMSLFTMVAVIVSALAVATTVGAQATASIASLVIFAIVVVGG